MFLMVNSGKYVNVEFIYSVYEWYMNFGDDSFMFDLFENMILDWVSYDLFFCLFIFYRKLIELF